MKRYSLSAIMVAVLLAGVPALRAQAIAPEVGEVYNLVKNGGFEEGERARFDPAHRALSEVERAPAGWGRYPARDEGGNYQARDTGAAHTGKASGFICSVTPYVPGKPWMQWSQYNFAVEGGSTVILSAYMKAQGAPGHIGLHYYGEGRKHLGFAKAEAPAKADDWTHLRLDVKLPDEARTAGFVLYAAEKGKTWYDDAAVIGTPKTQAVRATPTVDGKLDEACWSEGRAITTFVAHTGARVIAEKVCAWVAYDDANLYVAFRCPHPPGAKLRAEATQHDGNTWLDDSVEVFLDPNHLHKDHVQFCVNCLGVVRDSRGQDASWESGARAAVQREAEAWTVEVAIPYEHLGIGLDAGDTWGINLVWNDRVRGQTATWSLGGFHAPGRFGNVGLALDLARFYRADLAPRIEEKERNRQTVLKELQGAELPEGCLVEPMRLLNQARAALDELRAVAQPERDATLTKLAGISQMIAASREAAFDALFKAGPSGEKGNFRVVIAHSLQKIRRSGPVTDGTFAQRVRLDAAGDEAESFQLVVVPNGRALKDVTVETAPLVASNQGHTIPINWSRVGYVETAPPRYATDYVGWWPDPLMPPGPFDVAGDERQPLWFTVLVPPEAKPGMYTGGVTIRHGASAVSVPIELRVRGFRLPRPGTLPCPFSLYLPHFAKWWFGKDALKMPIETYARWCRFMGEYRLTPKNIARDYITQTQDAGGLHVDLSALKQTIMPLAAKYFPPYSFNLFRTPTGNAIGKTPTATDAEKIAAVVKAYVEEWKRQGLPEKVYIYGYDEPTPEHEAFLREAYKRIREAAPGYPIMQTLCGPDIPGLAGLVDIWCPITSRLNSPFYAQRKKAGDTLWTYVACGPTPPYANFLVDMPAIGHRILFWQARQYGATGFLYWCVCFWDGLPSAASGGPCFPDEPIHLKDLATYQQYKVNGDGFLTYPGKDMTPLSSIRLEAIRDGIEDYECLAMLARLVEKAKSLPPGQRPAPDVLQKAEALCLVPESISRTLTDYTKDPGQIFGRRREINSILEQLSGAVKE